MSAEQVRLEQAPRWVIAHLAEPHRTLSWAVAGGGMCITETVAWHQVNNADLPLDLDPRALMDARLRARGLNGAVGMLTSRDLRYVHRADTCEDDVSATAVVTAGFSNALRIGDPASCPNRPSPTGTINILCRISRPLCTSAALEAISLVAEARTAAVLAAGIASPFGPRAATGTGTDCIVMASPASAMSHALPYAGKHTAAGAAIGRAVLRAAEEATRTWQRAQPIPACASE